MVDIKIDRTRWGDKYAKRTAIARPDYEAGVRAPRRDPIEAAIGQKEALVARLTEVLAGTEWEDALRFVGTKGWQDAALTKGGVRYGPGVQFGLPKVNTFITAFAPHLERVVGEVLALPGRTLDERVARAVAQIRGNAEFRLKKR